MKKACLIFILLSTALAAQSGKVGFALLKIGVDARAAGMANAYTSIAHDASAVYWNPAGLAGDETNSLLLMHHSWLQDINHEFVALKFVSGQHNLAVSLDMISVSGIELRNEIASDDPIGETNALNTYLGLAYATTLFTDWQIGMQVKYLYEKYYMQSADGIAFDLGIQKKNIFNQLNWGFTIQNIGRMSSLKEQSTRLPVLLRTGISYYLPFRILNQNPQIAADITHVLDDVSLLHMGTEVPLTEYVDLRFGYLFGRASQSISAGFGLRYNVFNLAYAFVPYRYDLGNSHRFSLVVEF